MVEEIVNTNLDPSGIATAIGGWLLYIIVVSVLLLSAGFVLAKLRNLLRYRIDVEFYERKGKTCSYHSDDNARMVIKDGVSEILFLKNKGLIFKDHSFPSSEVIIKKRGLQRSKLKMLIDGDELTPMYPDFTLSEEGARILDSIPSYHKEDFLHRAAKYHKKYKNSDDNTRKLIIAGYAGGAILMLFGLFVVWQSNVAASEAIGSGVSALTGAVQQLAAQSANTLPAGP